MPHQNEFSRVHIQTQFEMIQHPHINCSRTSLTNAGWAVAICNILHVWWEAIHATILKLPRSAPPSLLKPTFTSNSLSVVHIYKNSDSTPPQHSEDPYPITLEKY